MADFFEPAGRGVQHASLRAANRRAVLTTIAFSAGGQTPGVPPSVGVAAVVTLGYSGFLVAPPILGFVAHGYGLSASLAIVLVMALLIAIGTLRRKAA